MITEVKMKDTYLLYILIVLTLALIGLCVLVLTKIKNLSAEGDGSAKGFFDSMLKTVGEEFSRSRSENQNAQRVQREEMTQSLGRIEQKLIAMNEDNYRQRLSMNETLAAGLENILKSTAAQSERQTATVQAAVEKMQQSNEQRLEQMRVTVDEKLSATLATRLDSSFKSVSEQLENVYKSLGEMKVLSTGVTDNVTALNRILTNVKVRGTWAEVQLDGILSETIPGMYERNVNTGDSRELVEFAVKIPSSDDKGRITYLPVDSKFPVEDYVRLCDAADRGDRDGVNEARKALSRRVLTFAKDVSKYINEPVTTPFAIMYLATEGLYSEIINSPDGIAERAHSEFGVMIAGPSTITALLNSLALGFRAMAINEKTREIRTLLAAAKMQYDKFGDLLQKARKKIDEAGKSLDDAQFRNTQIQKKLRGVEEIDSGSAADLLGIEE